MLYESVIESFTETISKTWFIHEQIKWIPDELVNESFAQPVWSKPIHSLTNQVTACLGESLNHSLNWFVQKHWLIHEQSTTNAQRCTAIHYALTLYETIFLGKAKTGNLSCLKCKLLNINLLFIELLYKNSITQWL